MSLHKTNEKQSTSVSTISSKFSSKISSSPFASSSPVILSKAKNDSKSLSLFGFTLVELIVVIVILGILATVAFLSFSDQSGTARDGVRLSDISSASRSLELFITKASKYRLNCK